MTNLAKELKLTGSFENISEEVMVNLMRTSGLLMGKCDEYFKQHGLTRPQYNVLRILRGAGESGLPTQDIAERLVNRLPDITRLVDRLVARDFARRTRSKNDRRVVYVGITDAGLQFLDKVTPPMEQMIREALGHVSDHQKWQLIELLSLARVNVE